MVCIDEPVKSFEGRDTCKKGSKKETDEKMYI